MTDAFSTAKWYDARDNERLTNESPEEEICEMFQDRDGSAEEWLADHEEIEVRALSERKVEMPTEPFAADVIEAALDSFADNYGDPDDPVNPFADHLAVAVARKKIAIVLADMLALLPVWQCEQVATRTYTQEEIRAILVESEPEAFEPEPPDTATGDLFPAADKP